MSEVAALFLSFAFIFTVIGIASILLSRGYVSGEVSRKIIHIGVSNWWLFAMMYMSSPLIASIGPVSFIIINFISYKRYLFPAMEDDVPRNNLGTIYFPVSLLILVLLCFAGPLSLSAGAAGILVMGYGDGLAALIGVHYGRHKIQLSFWRSEKSLEGSATMLLASLLVLTLLTLAAPAAPELFGPDGVWPKLILLAFLASLIELVTPRGFDNISVPILTALLFEALIR